MQESSRGWITEAIPRLLGEFRAFVSGLTLNFALVAGVVALGWGLTEIALIYLIEITIINLLFFSVALFTPQPVDDLDGDSWDDDPTPIQPVALVPPVYWRNIKLVGKKALVPSVLIWGVARPVVSSYGVDSGLPVSLGLAIAGTCLFQLIRVWRYFIADQSYQDKSPADAMEFAFAPVLELYLILMYVITPVTIVLAGIAFAMDTNLNSRAILLVYLVPIGVIRAWIGSLNPQTDDLEIGFN